MARPKNIVLTTLFVLALGVAGPVRAQEPPAQDAEAPAATAVTGEWYLTVDVIEAVLELTQEGNVLTGTLSSDQGALDLEGEIEGKELVFWGFLDALTINFYATLEDNKTMVGTMEAGDGEFSADFVAVRVERR